MMAETRQMDGADIAAQAIAMKEQMRANILERFRQSPTGQAIGQAYDSDLARGAVGALRDAYRRIFEAGWYQKDVFDGRFHMDNNLGRDNQSVEGMEKQYDTRQSFYGWDSAGNSQDGNEQAYEQEQEEPSYEMEHDNDNEMEP